MNLIFFFSDSMILNPILNLTAHFCLSFAFWRVEKTPVKWKKKLAALMPQIAVVYKWIFSAWNNVEWPLFLGNNNWMCANFISYFFGVILFCKQGRESLVLALTDDTKMQLCQSALWKKGLPKFVKTDLCCVLVNSSQYCDISRGPWQASNLTCP